MHQMKSHGSLLQVQIKPKQSMTQKKMRMKTKRNNSIVGLVIINTEDTMKTNELKSHMYKRFECK